MEIRHDETNHHHQGKRSTPESPYQQHKGGDLDEQQPKLDEQYPQKYLSRESIGTGAQPKPMLIDAEIGRAPYQGSNRSPK